MATSGLASAGYAALPNLLAAMRAGPNRGPFVMHADVENSDNLTTQTVEQMALLIKESIADDVTQSVAQRVCESWVSDDPRVVVSAVWWFAKNTIKFVLDESAVHQMFGKRNAIELLVSPALMLRSRKMQGDCDDFTMMICALLGCRGLGYEIITVAANPRDPGTFSHVYCRAILPDGSRVPLDASHGKYPGWQVPTGHVSRFQAWDADGNAVQDAGSNNWGGLHGYEVSRGLGACLEYDDSGTCTVDDGSGSTCPTGLVMLDGTCVIPGTTVSSISPIPSACPTGLVMLQGTCVIPGTTVSSSTAGGVNTTPGVSSSIASLLAGIFGPGSQIANAALAPKTPAGTINVPTNSLLLYGGLAVLGVIFISLAGKK